MLGYSSTHPAIFSFAVWATFFLLTYVEQVVVSPSYLWLKRYLPLQWLLIWLALGVLIVDSRVIPGITLPQIVFVVAILASLTWLHLRRPPVVSAKRTKAIVVFVVSLWVGLLIAK